MAALTVSMTVTRSRIYKVNGVAYSSSADFDTEVGKIKSILKLRPGMTYCELGAANGIFFAEMAKAVMPGGRIMGTALVGNETKSFTNRALDSGISKDSVVGVISTNNPPLLGLPQHTCDAVLARRIYHGLPLETALAYLPQLGAAVKPGGTILIVELEPDNGIYTRPGATVFTYGDGRHAVVPAAVQIEEFKSAGFKLERVFLDWPHFDDPPDLKGTGLVYSPPTSQIPSDCLTALKFRPAEEVFQAVYNATDYVVYELSDVMRIGERTPKVDELLGANSVGGADSAVFITASNPKSQQLSQDENDRRNERLLARVESLGPFRVFAGEGRARFGDWPPERSYLIIGLPTDMADGLADEFDQIAYVMYTAGGPAKIVWRPRRWPF